jgi:predicted transcriptional regulator
VPEKLSSILDKIASSQVFSAVIISLLHKCESRFYRLRIHNFDTYYKKICFFGIRDMLRRSRLEIYFDILNTIEKGTVKPTRIMYKTNLSWETLQDMFDTLIKGGFIKEETKKNSKVYQVTEKGRNALVYYGKSLDGLVQAKQIISM